MENQGLHNAQRTAFNLEQTAKFMNDQNQDLHSGCL